MTYEKLTFDVTEGVATITLNRPDVLNALDTALLAELADAGARIDAEPEIRVAIFTGAGRAFCAGGDLKATRFTGVGTMSDQDPAEHWAAKLLAIEKPTIAAVNGISAGGGLSLALACDLRVASDRARFSAIFARIGMPVLDGAGWLLPRAVGEAKALEMLFTAEQVPAEEALRIGLVSRVVPHEALHEEARTLAGRIAANAPVAQRLSKRVVRGGLTLSFSEHLPLQWRAMDENLATARHDVEEGGRAFAEKREPRFRGLLPG